MLIRSISFSTAQWVGSLLFGSVILWQIADHSGSTKGRAIVHVVESGVEVKVNDARYWVETLWESPVIFELTPGRHTARMNRAGRVVYHEEFTLGRGEEIILMACDGYEDGRSPKGPP